MENFLPSDIWRACVLPYLDMLSRVELNRLLDPETRVAEKMATEDVARRMGTKTIMDIVDHINESKTVLDKVKRTTRLFVFVRTPLGLLVLKTGTVSHTFLKKIDGLEAEYPSQWWKRSHYRKRLMEEMEKVRHIILTTA
jgi:hypothetical protein